VSSPQHLEAPNLPEPQDSSEGAIGSTMEVAPVVDLSTTVGETTKSTSSPQFLEVPNSSERQESSEVSTASAMDVTPAIEPSTAVGDGGLQPSQQHRVASAQKESEADRDARIRAWVRKEIARRDAERAAAGRSR
jgi:hypothetical protein